MSATGARSPAVDEALLKRFAAELERLWPEGGRPGSRLGLAVSGGPDSLALLLLAEATLPGRFEVATVDHGLRPASAAECASVADACSARGIPCAVLPVGVAGGNLQAAAREARYAALTRWASSRGLGAVATAHHADDQAETLLMRLNRGSGVAGLAGVRERSWLAHSEIALVRPLLSFRRAELAGLVAASGLAPVQDPSNADDRFDRARMRKAIAGSAWLDPLALAAAAANLAAADEALEWAAGREWNERVVGSGDQIRYRRLAPKAVAMRVVARIIADFGGRARGQELARLLARLEAGESGSLGGVLARVEDGEWVFAAEPPRREGA